MTIFNIIETFFFISLAITFVLIVLLIYHFKQRMVILEQKQDTLVEIINNIVKELTCLKKTFNDVRSIPFISPLSEIVDNGKSKFMNFVNKQNDTVFGNMFINETKNDKYQEDEYKDEDEDECKDEDEYKDEDEDECKDEDEDECKDEDEDEYKDEDEDEYKDEAECKDEDEAEYKYEEIIKEIQETTQYETFNDNKMSLQNTTVLDLSEQNEELEEITINNSVESVELFNENTINKANNMVPYRKMNIHELKTIAISYGLITDTSKIKKNDLIELLENMDLNK